MDPASVLPMEIMEEILLYLDSKELGRCAMVSRDWKSIVYSQRLWRIKYLEDAFPIVDEHYKGPRLTPMSGCWVKEYRDQAMPSVAPSEFLQFTQSATISARDYQQITSFNTDGKLLAIQYAYQFIEIYNVNDIRRRGTKEPEPIQHIDHPVSPELDNSLFITSTHLIIIQAGKLSFYKCYSGIYRHAKTWGVQNRLNEVVTKDYIYMIYSRSLTIWSLRRLCLVKNKFLGAMKLCYGLDTVCLLDKDTATILSGSVETTYNNLNMTVISYSSNKYFRVFYGHDNDYWIVLYRMNGDLVFRHKSFPEVVHIDPLLDWGFKYEYWGVDKWCWAIHTLDGKKVCLDSSELHITPIPLYHKYMLYQTERTLCLFDVTLKNVVSKLSMGHYYYYTCANGIIVVRDAYSAAIYFFHDRYLT